MADNRTPTVLTVQCLRLRFVVYISVLQSVLCVLLRVLGSVGH